ncbi:alpha/beta hydrolase [Abyssisolibacter fermentans]|uniref:alpha/beta hydrolase n=1 Tax=Abyssisolibacter fermentans TaxID=1766203 RepID=UPI000835B099|nr:alpha/beta hydrolase [Abyssisolibacter fermentans]
MRHKKIIKKGSMVLVVFLMISILIGILLAYIPSRMTKKHTNEIVELFLNDMNYDLLDFNNKYGNKIRDIELSSRYGHKIPVKYIFSDNSFDNSTIVLVHWHETNHTAMIPLAEMFLANGYNVVLYDQRAHGENTAKTVTFGYYEKDDLEDVIEYIESQMSKENIIGVLGQSMGAATIGYYLGSFHASQHLDFAIMDSSFGSMYSEIKWNIEMGTKVQLPTTYFLKLGSMANLILFGYTYEEVSILEAMKNNMVPTLILHSKTDMVCPYYMGKDLHNAIPHNEKRMITFENSNHVEAFFNESERYKEEVLDFISYYTE